MTVSARKITAFAKLVAGLADTPNLGSTTLLKQWFDSSPEELRVAFNGLIDDLIATAAGASGTEQIGSAPISGVAGATAYAQLVDLKAQLNAAVIGTIPDGTLDYVKLNAATKDLITEYGMSRQITINGGFDVWQRGTSFTGGYTADRWYGIIGPNATFSKLTATPPVGSSSYARVTINTLGGYFNFGQALESDTCNKLKGKTISASIQMRRDATFDGQYQIVIEKNATADTAIGGTWTIISSATFTPSTSWAIYKLENIAIPNDATANGLRVQIAAIGGTRPLNSYVEFAQVQMNTGSIALPFQPKSFADELLACQRYYEKSYTYIDAPGTSAAPAGVQHFNVPSNTIANNQNYGTVYLKVKKRIPAGTITIYPYTIGANTGRVSDTAGTDLAVSSGVAFHANENSFTVRNQAGVITTVGNEVLFHYALDAEL